ncbi:MAG: DUF2094 domain-containing protein [Sedimentisphaerales bacterium]|nr:DUF2094 domain-containing protein [Sedimentisphaerales bacterium]
MRRFGQWLNGSRGSRWGSRIIVAAFGKHPAWADFMDDVGLATPALVAIKRLYMEGIEKNIGKWAELESKRPIVEFGHAFVWRKGRDVVAGRLWPSRDRQGRTSYPMVVCAHCRRVSTRWVYDLVLPRLASLETECQSSDSASDVLASISTCESALQMMLRDSRSCDREPREKADRIAQLMDYSGLGPDDEGLIRILYHIDRGMSAGLVSRARRDGYTHSADARAPASGSHVVDAAILWTSLLLSQYGRHTGVLIIIPQQQAWIDVLVGEPTPAQLYCLRASTEALPLTNTVLYKIGDEFVERVKRRVGVLRARGGR